MIFGKVIYHNHRNGYGKSYNIDNCDDMDKPNGCDWSDGTENSDSLDIPSTNARSSSTYGIRSGLQPQAGSAILLTIRV